MPGAQQGGAPAGKRGRPKVTMIAGKALNLADTFAMLLSNPFPGWQAEAAAPVGPSTGGGKQAKQHISLIAPSGQRLAIGSVDWSQGAATLRSFAVVDHMHRQRFQQPLPLAQQDFGSFLDRLAMFLKGSNITVTMDNHLPESRSLRPPPNAVVAQADKSSAVVWIVVLVIALLAVVVLAIWLWVNR